MSQVRGSNRTPIHTCCRAEEIDMNNNNINNNGSGSGSNKHQFNSVSTDTQTVQYFNLYNACQSHLVNLCI